MSLPPLLKRVVETAIPPTSQGLPSISVEYHLSEDLPEIYGDSVALRKALLNVILNAIQAMPNGGLLEVGCRRVYENAASESPGEYIEVLIADTGAGIPKEDIERIFHPFFTTKDQGTGLGLAISRKIVEGHGGTIRVQSHVGKGTTIYIRLPVIPSLSKNTMDSGGKHP
jgi:signal transduction histidine kinase